VCRALLAYAGETIGDDGIDSESWSTCGSVLLGLLADGTIETVKATTGGRGNN
jgi:hypothetical protein